MIWYAVPVWMTGSLFILMLIATALYLVMSFSIPEWVKDKQALVFLLVYYSLLTLISAVLAIELLLGIASIEGGVFISIAAWPRYSIVLLPCLLVWQRRAAIKTPSELSISLASYWVPLLCLPPLGILSEPLPILFNAFTVFWLVITAFNSIYMGVRYSQNQITYSVLAEVFIKMKQGVCVINQKGWVLEYNQAFSDFCGQLGISKLDSLAELDDTLMQQSKTAAWRVEQLDKGLSINDGNKVYYLQRHLFKKARKQYLQLTLSDVSQLSAAALALEQKNEVLQHSNHQLARSIEAIEAEASRQSRDKTCREVHDTWSQRLAVAGLSLDNMIMERSTRTDSGKYDAAEKRQLIEIANLLNLALTSDLFTFDYRLQDYLYIIRKHYLGLGVHIKVKGHASFSQEQDQVLCVVVREAMANAVRHAYAREVSVQFISDKFSQGLVIINKCLDDSSDISMGRGLYDLEKRVQEVGGQLIFSKCSIFQLEVVFPVGQPVSVYSHQSLEIK